MKTEDLGAAIVAGLHVMQEQRVKGLAKYGVAVEDAPLTLEQIIRHAQEEMADGLVYTSLAVSALHRRLEDERINLIGDVLNILDNPKLNDDIKREQVCALATEVPVWKVMFVQPSSLTAAPGTNLLTLNRERIFPFTQAVMVRA